MSYTVLHVLVKALVGAFNQEKALVRAFSVVVQLCVTFAKVRLKLYYTLYTGDILQPPPPSHGFMV